MEERVLDENFLNLFRELINDRLGIYISKEKDYLLQNKINRLLNYSKFKNFAELYYALKNGQQEIMEQLIRFITTTHTFFFRENIHMKILKNDILLRKIEKPLIWCAASSTGEEVYSILIELLENNITNFVLVATDINKEVLHHLKKGIYHLDRMKELNSYYINKYFDEYKKDGKEGYYQVKKFLKNYFIIKQLNLVDEFRFEKKFNYIFCRNVLIYFDKETQKQVINNLLNNLDDLGYLFVGHSESLLNITNKVEAVFASVYNKLIR